MQHQMRYIQNDHQRCHPHPAKDIAFPISLIFGVVKTQSLLQSLGEFNSQFIKGHPKQNQNHPRLSTSSSTPHPATRKQKKAMVVLHLAFNRGPLNGPVNVFLGKGFKRFDPVLFGPMNFIGTGELVSLCPGNGILHHNP